MNATARRLSTTLWLAAAAAAGCSTATEFDSDTALMPFANSPAERVAVVVLGDGFVRTGDRRIPLELLVLELRQRARAMTDAQRAGLRVHIDVAPDGGDPAMRAAERLLDELQVMGVQQVTFL